MPGDKLIDPYAKGTPQTAVAAAAPSTALVDPYAEGTPAAMPAVEMQTNDAWSAANILRQAAGQGLALGFGDEIEGFLSGVYAAAAEGKDLQTAINEGIDYARSQNLAFETQYPKSALGLQVVGGALTGGAGATRALAKQGLSMGAKAARGAATGGTVGGIAGAGMAEGDLSDRAVGAGYGAGFGALGGAALPALATVGKKVMEPVGRMLPGGSERQASNRLRNVMAEDEKLIPQVEKELAELGPEGMVADVMGPHGKDLARWAGNKAGGKQAQTILDERHLNQGLRIADGIDINLSDVPLDDFLRTTSRRRSALAERGYSKLYEKTVPASGKLRTEFLENKAIQRAYAEASDIAEAEGLSLPPLFKELADGTKLYAKPTMRQLDFIKQALDDKVSSSYMQGKGKLGSSLQTLRDDFRDHVDDLIPEYKNVRSVYAGHSAAMDAAELGAKFITSPKHVSTHVIKKMGEHERQAFVTGIADSLRYKVLSAPDAADVVKRIFGNHLARQRLKAAFGNDTKKYASFKKLMENEAKMADTNARVRFGSRTAPMEMDDAAMAKNVSLMTDAMLASGGSPMHSASLLRNLTEKFSAPSGAIAKRISDALLSQDPKARAMALKMMQGGETAGSQAGRYLRAPAAGVAGLLSAD